MTFACNADRFLSDMSQGTISRVDSQNPEIAKTTSNYAEIAPDQRFAGQVVCYWSHGVDRSNAGFIQPVYPDGCVDILWRNTDEPVVVGAMSGYQESALDSDLRLAGVRLYPGIAKDLFGIPANEFTDQEVPLREISGFAAAARPFAATSQTQKFSESMNRRLYELLSGAASQEPDPWARAAVRWLAQNPGKSIRPLAELLNVSERHLNRRFAAAVGYGPKLFQRIARFQRLLGLAASASSLADLAFAAGYADQAHMTRESRALSGRTPAALRTDSHPALAISDLF